MESTYFRKGFGLKGAIEGQLTSDYHSAVIEALRANDYTLEVGPLTFRLAREFGFCYGVDRAVEYAYETRRKFPDKRLFLVGEIIHNPHVNRKLEAMGIHFLYRPDDGEFDFSPVTPDDVVIMPAFGVTMADFQRLRALGCVLVDTTCGSVLNVWKRVDAYARDGYTAIIHGKYWHEETKATASQVEKYPGGKYLVVLDMEEARQVMEFMEHGGDASALATKFASAVSSGFDFAQDLQRVGLANQTTMLSGESLAIAAEFRRTMERIHGAERRGVVGPDLRHDLLRHPGAAGRRRAAAGGAAGPDDGGGRVQQFQHLPPGGAFVQAGGPDLPHRGCRRGRSHHRPPPAPGGGLQGAP